MSGSRDDTARLWCESSKAKWEPSTIYKGHTRYVSSVAYREPDETYNKVQCNIIMNCFGVIWWKWFYIYWKFVGKIWFTSDFQGLVYTGCLDGLIRAYEPQTPDPHHTLEGHTGAVASIFVSANKVTV